MLIAFLVAHALPHLAIRAIGTSKRPNAYPRSLFIDGVNAASIVGLDGLDRPSAEMAGA